MEISYDYGYSKKYFNGNIAGIKWRNVGNLQPLRSYGYNYDAYNRLTSGDFVYKRMQIDAPYPWETTVDDFTASNMTYDENGNIKSMKQMGKNTAGQKIIVDDLSYAYGVNSNKLLSVTESSSSQSKDPSVYDGLGDFRDLAGSTDYNYDAGGNLLSDANKNLAFTYDEIINKTKFVQRTAVTGVGYLYDATGNKIQKSVSGATPATTDYIGSAIYINNSLSSIQHPEGRIRYKAGTSAPYMYDYFIKDHLGSTRSVITITDGAITGFAKSAAPASNEVKYIATSETENAAKENQLFDNVDNTRSPNLNKKTLNDNYVAKIYSSSSKTILGPDITIKVMAGDCVKVSAEALYIAEKNNPKEVAQNAITNFITAFTVPLGLAAEGVTTTANNGLKNLANAILDMQNKQAKNGSPKAFLNYILYDEYMNLVAAGSGALQIKEKEGWQTLETEKMAIPQNGFLRVFSNNMEAAPMSINNTTLAVIPSKLVEEYNYYPYGLVFGSSSAASSVKKTDYLYNGKELQRNEFGQNNGLELTDYGARLYDQQIGRWNHVDPMAHERVSLSPYNYCSNDPINRVDPTGALDDWVKNNSSGEYEWMDNVTSAENTPEGYSYVGASGSDILKDINPNFSSSLQSQSSNRIGYIAADVEEGKYAVNHLINVQEKSSISVSADISFNFANKTANNSMGRTFNGINVSSTIISSNSDMDGSMSSGAKLNVSYGGKSFMSSFGEPTQPYVKATGTSIGVASISIPASSLTKNVGLSANVSGGWWATNSSNLMTPVVYHPTVPIPQSFKHTWNIQSKATPIPKYKQ